MTARVDDRDLPPIKRSLVVDKCVIAPSCLASLSQPMVHPLGEIPETASHGYKLIPQPSPEAAGRTITCAQAASGNQPSPALEKPTDFLPPSGSGPARTPARAPRSSVRI